jgi:hexosaminidase
MLESSLILLPIPRQVTDLGASVSLSEDSLITIPDASLLFEARMAQSALADHAGLSWPIVAGQGYERAGLILTINNDLTWPESYRLVIENRQITIHGADAAGVFYGVCTLRQILQQRGAQPPSLDISDGPDFTVRGVMLDISRDRVPTLQTVLDLVDRLASWKINQLQLYMEHTFAYQRHPQIWAEASPFTGEDILRLDAFCRERHIELAPNQNSLGHMERWLKFDRYNLLAECPDGFTHRGDIFSAPTTLDPFDKGSLALVAELFDELLPHFSSRLLNIGGDEPWELGMGKSRELMEQKGHGRGYLEYLLMLREQVIARNHQMLFWADIIIKYPELVPELPRDMVALEWGYEATHPFDENCAQFAKAGIPFYVCPGTSSWNSLSGRTTNSMGNLRNAAANGLKHGATGYLITDWGDNGHWQPLPISYLGFAYGAALAWAYEANHDLDLPRALDHFAFEDTNGVMGKLAYQLGDIDRSPGLAYPNGQMLFSILQQPQEKTLKRMTDPASYGSNETPITPEILRTVLRQIDEIMQPIRSADMQRSDATLIQDEYRLIAEMLRHACYRGLLILGEPIQTGEQLGADLDNIVARYQQNWSARSRPGGLADSVRRFDTLANEYHEPVVS